MSLASTRFHQLSPALARLLLAAFAVSLMALLAVALMAPSSIISADGSKGPGDLEMYRSVVAALQHGASYYDALRTALLDGGYGSLSVFNWRPPFFLSAVALSPQAAHGVLLALAGAALLLSLAVVQGLGSRLVVTACLVLGLAGVLAPGAAYMCEIYAGVLILLSVAAYARGWIWLGVATAVLALLCRELSALYVIVCLVIAIKGRRWPEVAAWVAAIVAFAAYYAWHASTVLGLLGLADRAYPEGWVQFGGISFILATAQFNGAFLLLPMWVTALLLPTAVLGLLGWRDGVRGAATVLAYVAAFAIIGKPENAYWGALYAPLVSLGMAWALPALRDLVRAAR